MTIPFPIKIKRKSSNDLNIKMQLVWIYYKEKNEQEYNIKL